MNQKIATYLKQLEEERDITILLACETGSRAWGFPSPDSDYDVRVIYTHPKDWYVSLHQKRDHFNLMFDDNMIDMTGWDLRKSLNLLYRSNAALLERIQSPLIYTANKQFHTEINDAAEDFYAPIAVMYHYLSLAKKMMNGADYAESMKLKTLFYALRSALVCKWVSTHDSRPPISIFDLINGLEIPSPIKQRILDLIALKKQMDESYVHPKEPELVAFINEILFRATVTANSLSGARKKTPVLNNFFLRWLETEKK